MNAHMGSSAILHHGGVDGRVGEGLCCDLDYKDVSVEDIVEAIFGAYA
jgi:hypothetical protein